MKLNINRIILKLILVTGLITTSLAANAGIPVLDATSLTQAIKSFTQLEQQYAMLTQQYTQLQSLQSIATGSRGLGTINNDPSVTSSLPSDWTSVLASVKSTSTYSSERAKYPNSTSPKLNALYDQKAADSATMIDFYKKANGRISQVKSLLLQIDSASDPAAKADLNSRLLNEQNAINADRQLLTLIKAKSEQDNAAAARAANVERVCSEFKRPGC